MQISWAALSIQPLGRVDEEILGFLRDELSSLWGEVRIEPAKPMPRPSYNPNRDQYDGPRVLEGLKADGDMAMGVTEMDLYLTGLNFIFGMASRRKTLISLHRLRPEFYRAAPDMKLLKARVMKEAMHELGHGLGLGHCPQISCVMHLSSSVVDIDLKDRRCCRRCSLSLTREGIDLPASLSSMPSPTIRVTEAIRPR